MNSTISRRHFLGTMGATAAAASGLGKLLANEPAKDNIRLGMMLQGGSAAELQEKAKAIAAVGFERVQVTFFFHPTVDDLKTLSRTLSQTEVDDRSVRNLLQPLPSRRQGLHGFQPGDHAARRRECGDVRL